MKSKVSIHNFLEFGHFFMITIMGKTFSANLRRILAAKGWTQVMLSEKTGISQSSVSYWLSGKTVPDAKTVDVLCYVLEVPLQEFFLNPDENPGVPNFVEREKIDLHALTAKLIESMGFEAPKRLKKRNK